MGLVWLRLEIMGRIIRIFWKSLWLARLLWNLDYCGSNDFYHGLFLLPLLKILHTPENIIKEAFEYINIITMFIGVTFSYNLSSGLLRAIGNSFMSLVFLVIASILNIFLDIYFITSLKMGIAGAATASSYCTDNFGLFWVSSIFT